MGQVIAELLLRLRQGVPFGPGISAQALVLVLFLVAAHVTAYIPAVATNDTNAVNQTDRSMLTMKWAPAGIYSNTVSFQLASNNSQGFQQGALVHFSEKGLSDQNTTTPWIALVNCDANTSDASQVDDIFTLARDRGAVAALLYSITSEACLINPEYASPENFEQILDIFATPSKSSAILINSQFSNLKNTSFGDYDAVQLNNSADSVTASLHTTNITSSFIVATLRSSNSSISPNGTDPDAGSNSGSSGQDEPPHGNPNTGLAMIILYAITGCVSALFIVVILSGAIRAIRHPERYGPRAGSANGGPTGTTPQSRTSGIGRAILDTFPIIKFGQASPPEAGPLEGKRPDVENQSPQIEMTPIEKSLEERTETPSSANPAENREPERSDRTLASSREMQTMDEEGEGSGQQAAPAPAQALASTSAAPTSDEAMQDTELPPDVRPAAIGHETCPICIVDFQEGDDLRVLPCEGKHKFHQTCVDPWLLDLSSSCPLCREDFQALESMISGSERDDDALPEVSVTFIPGTRSSRFSKYLKFARRRNRDAGPGPSQPDAPTDT